MGGRREQEGSAGSKDAADLREQAQPILNVLEHLARPNDIERLVSEGQLFPCQHELDRRGARSSPPQGLLRDVAARHDRPVLGQRRRELPQAATEIQDRLSLHDSVKEEVAGGAAGRSTKCSGGPSDAASDAARQIRSK